MLSLPFPHRREKRGGAAAQWEGCSMYPKPSNCGFTLTAATWRSSNTTEPLASGRSVSSLQDSSRRSAGNAGHRQIQIDSHTVVIVISGIQPTRRGGPVLQRKLLLQCQRDRRRKADRKYIVILNANVLCFTSLQRQQHQRGSSLNCSLADQSGGGGRMQASSPTATVECSPLPVRRV
jgi:hypothetical protein